MNLQSSLSIGSYDKTKTSLIGRVSQRTISPNTYLGSNRVQFMNVFDDAVTAPLNIHCATDSGRVFVMQTAAAGVATMALYNINYSTGATTYVGRLGFTIPAGTTTAKGLFVDDSNPSSLYIMLGTTNATTPANGGVVMVLNAGVSDFTPIIGATLPAATASGQKAAYFICDTTANTMQTLTSVCVDTVGGFLWVVNGVLATYQVFKYNYKGTITTVGATPVSGTTTDLFLFKTGNLPALTGTILLLNCGRYVTPGANATGAPANIGSPCLFIATNTNFFLGKASDLTTSGQTTWPSLATVVSNINNDTIPTVTPVGGFYSQTLDKVVYYTSGNEIQIKNFSTTDTDAKKVGFSNLVKSETGTSFGGNDKPFTFGALAIGSLTIGNGWIFITSTTAGQRGVYGVDGYSDQSFLNSYIITTPMDVTFGIPTAATFRNLIPKRSVRPRIDYRVSTTGTGDTIFDAFPGTWTTAPEDLNLSAIGTIAAIQFRISFDILNENVSNPPAINEGYLIYTGLNEIDEHWAGSVDATTSSGASPTRSGFKIIKSTSGTYYYRATDDSDNVITLANTSANYTSFDYSTDGGTVWTPFPSSNSYPSTVGTLIRYNHASPPGVSINNSLRTS